MPSILPFVNVSRWATALIAAGLWAGAPAVMAGRLVVYSSADADAVQAFGEAFAKAHKGIQVEWVRASTGALQQRLLAEKAQPKADVIFAHTAANMTELDREGLLQAVEPPGLERVGGRYLDVNEPPRWIGLYTWSTAFCWSRPQAAQGAAPLPRTWNDLLQPAFKGRVVMPDPTVSGTGAMMVTGWVRMWGETKAWAYMDRLHEQVSRYVRSGSKPCELAASAETLIGLSFPGRGARIKSAGADIDVLMPEDGTAWDLQAVAITRTTQNLKDALTFAQWAISNPAMETYARYGEVTSVKVRVQKQANLPVNIPERMIKQDFTWLAKEQPRILAEWKRRYSAKSEPAPR